MEKDAKSKTHGAGGDSNKIKDYRSIFRTIQKTVKSTYEKTDEFLNEPVLSMKIPNINQNQKKGVLIKSLALSPDGTNLFIGATADYGFLSIFNFSQNKFIYQIKTNTKSVNSIDLNRSGNLLITSGDDPEVQIYSFLKYNRNSQRYEILKLKTN